VGMMVKGESALTKLFLMSLQVRLADVKKVLEHRIGVGMEELDDYLHCYRFVPETLMSMIGYYVNEADPDPESLDEVAGEVDGFLWNFAETGSIAPDVFLSLFKVMMLQDLQRSMSKDKKLGAKSASNFHHLSYPSGCHSCSIKLHQMKNESVLPICPILEFISTKATISKNACQTSAMRFSGQMAQ